MDNTKLNELAAKAMGWVLEITPSRKEYIWHTPNQQDGIYARNWNPAGCADDAMTVLIKTSIGWAKWILICDSDPIPSIYECWIQDLDDDGVDRRRCYSKAYTAPLAMTLCALRASPEVTEEQIQEAMA